MLFHYIILDSQYTVCKLISFCGALMIIIFALWISSAITSAKGVLILGW